MPISSVTELKAKTVAAQAMQRKAKKQLGVLDLFAHF